MYHLQQTTHKHIIYLIFVLYTGHYTTHQTPPVKSRSLYTIPVKSLDTPTHSKKTGCVRACWPRRKVMECCIRWPGLLNHPTSTQLRWDELDRRVKEKQATSDQYMWELFKTVGKAFQVKLVDRMPRVCKAVIKAKGGYFEESKKYNIFWFV